MTYDMRDGDSFIKEKKRVKKVFQVREKPMKVYKDNILVLGPYVV